MGHDVFMDDIDKAILRSLQNDVRQTNRQLAASVGLAPSSCLARVRSLEQKGIVRGAHADVDLVALGRGAQAMVSLKIKPSAFGAAGAFEKWIAALPETLSVFMVSGAADFLVHVAVQDTARLREFVLSLAGRPEIADIRTSIVFDHTRTQVVSPFDPVPAS